MPDSPAFWYSFFNFLTGELRRAEDNRTVLDDIRNRLKHLQERVEKLMALSQESRDLLKKVDTATSAIGARIQALLDKEGTTEAEFRAALTPLAESLEAMGKDPNNPVPPLPPVP